MNFIEGCIVIGGIGGLAIGFAAALGDRLERRRAGSTKSLREFVRSVEQVRVLPEVDAPDIRLQPGEFAIHRCAAAVSEVRDGRIGGAIGSGTRVFGIPLYFGGYRSVPVPRMSDRGTGVLTLTNRRIVFVSAGLTVGKPLYEVLACWPAEGRLYLAFAKIKTPLAFAVDEVALWEFLVKWISDLQPDSPVLSPSVHLDFEPGARGEAVIRQAETAQPMF